MINTRGGIARPIYKNVCRVRSTNINLLTEQFYRERYLYRKRINSRKAKLPLIVSGKSFIKD